MTKPKRNKLEYIGEKQLFLKSNPHTERFEAFSVTVYAYKCPICGLEVYSSKPINFKCPNSLGCYRND